jgi:hypothetical protein
VWVSRWAEPAAGTVPVARDAGLRVAFCCWMQDAFAAPYPLTINNIIQVSVLNQVSRRVSSDPTHVAHSILYTCLYRSQLRCIYMLFENRNCLYKKSDVLLRSACFIFARKCKVEHLAGMRGCGTDLLRAPFAGRWNM